LLCGTNILILYVIDLPQKSSLCSDELFESPFSHRKLFCYPIAMNNRCVWARRKSQKNFRATTFERY